MRVLILGEVGAGSVGGGESVIVGFVRGLSELGDTGDHYTVLCEPSLAEQLRPLAAPFISIITRPIRKPTGAQRLKSALGVLRKPLGKLLRRLSGRPDQGNPVTLPVVDPFVRSIPHDVLHFAFPMHFATGGKNSVFGLYDLQHEHLPEIFSAEYIRYRRMLYDGVAREAQLIVSISRFTTKDFLAKHPCDPAKLFTVPLGPYVGEEKQLELSDEDKARLAEVPGDFILYPAFSYRHKNHRTLLGALSLAERKYGVKIPLVCTGGRSPEWSGVLNDAAHLQPKPELKDLGYTSRALLQDLFRRCRFVCFPSLFEGQGLPLIEAGRCGRAIACSDIEVFREFGADGPLYFDPSSTEDIAQKLAQLWRDPVAQGEIAYRMGQRSASLSQTNTALEMRAIYRKAAGEPLNAEDRAILARTVATAS
jgi:glycosyltransferase involved in cell wall biosynthesis